MLSTGRESKKEIPDKISGAKIGILISGPTVYHATIRQGVNTVVQQTVLVLNSQGTVVNDKMLTARPGGEKQ